MVDFDELVRGRIVAFQREHELTPITVPDDATRQKLLNVAHASINAPESATEPVGKPRDAGDASLGRS